MNETELDRYSRQILLANFDYMGQQRLLDARILMVGVGGLGNIAASYLTAAGIGHLTLVDDDFVESSNLQRQVLFKESNIGQKKVDAAKMQLSSLNSSTQIDVIDARLSGQELVKQIQQADLVMDCTDNFVIRQQINQACHAYKTPLVSAAAIRWEGQIVSFLFDQAMAPCYQCLYPNLSDNALNCSQSGIISPVVGSIGVLQSLEALKIISQCGVVTHGVLKLFDGFNGQWRELTLTADPDCKVCHPH
ncbi:molybdopterin-synthase adenylyltransferase MoeB [Marinomonas sp. 15G1-11]|uniref:Molybdopterin-synthase adenylyltransferase MoeB n=1 Tax=Marinomonas phaeophyticola TaxID=3004091 RepID=A0ABT4JP66_9GAMM|nr:molybdopterin-synthase adenylyltransferase MoeB [Marinomonas sp. 15G1-11]MCZ2720091.1 molybdopterin-synthase adenylyltransferase MoeB [Marinomonas sp. 15G1-11]